MVGIRKKVLIGAGIVSTHIQIFQYFTCAPCGSPPRNTHYEGAFVLL